MGFFKWGLCLTSLLRSGGKKLRSKENRIGPDGNFPPPPFYLTFLLPGGFVSLWTIIVTQTCLYLNFAKVRKKQCRTIGESVSWQFRNFSYWKLKKICQNIYTRIYSSRWNFQKKEKLMKHNKQEHRESVSVCGRLKLDYCY